MAFAVKDVGKEPVGAGFGRRLYDDFAPVRSGDALPQSLWLRLRISAPLQVSALLHYFPGVAQGILVGVAGEHLRRVCLARFEMNTLLGCLAVEPGPLESRAPVGGPGAAPKIVQHVHGCRFLPCLQEHSIPGRCPFLLLTPQEYVRADTLSRVGLNHRLVALFIKIRFCRAVVFERRPPIRFADLPMAGRAPFRHQVGPGPAGFLQIPRQVHDVGVHLNG